MDVINILDKILEELDNEIDKYRNDVLYSRINCERSWERSVRKYDELLIRKYQTGIIKKYILNEEE